MYSSLIHWYRRPPFNMACQIVQTCRANVRCVNYAQTMRKLCVNSSCKFMSIWTLMGMHSCTHRELVVYYA